MSLIKASMGITFWIVLIMEQFIFFLTSPSHSQEILRRKKGNSRFLSVVRVLSTRYSYIFHISYAIRTGVMN